MTGISEPLTYNSYVSAIATLAVVPTQVDAGGIMHFTEPNLDGVVAQMLNYAELRIQRDLNFLASQKTRSYALPDGVWELDIPFDDFVTVQNITLAGVTDATVFSALTPVSKEFFQTVYPDPEYAATPKYFAPIGGELNPAGATYHVYALAPKLDQPYKAYVTGTTRMPSLFMKKNTEASTGTTFVSSQMPDLLLMASMVFLSAYQRNFSSSGSDPQMPINYETQYQTLLKGTMTEEMRRRFLMVPGSSDAPSPANMKG
jgi:hypothetical protein